ncbi:hypothetical protein [Streptomyces sp. NPDC049040]|uniref:hypothetical protein n=1 Tax=Streptomyces sp. NPDC049040 TaxID=3365593 RepID=UPI003712DF2C
MRVRCAIPAFATTVVAAVVLSACGGGSGDGGSETIPPAAPTTAAATTAPSGTPGSRTGAPLTLDPAVALPADVKVVFDWTMPEDPAQHAALTAAANYLQSIDHAVVRQNAQDPPLHAYAAGDALAYAGDFVQRNIEAKLTLSGTDRFYRPVFGNGAAGTGGSKGSVEIRLCDDQSKIYSKDVVGGKVHVTAESDKSYVLFDIVLVELPTAHPYWQAQGITVKEGFLQCKD